MYFLRINYNTEGFSLPEILVVILTLGALISMSLPNYFIMAEKTKSAEGTQILGNLLAAQRIYAFENNGNYAQDIGDLDIEIPAMEYFESITDSNINQIDPLATIERKGDYTLRIFENGTIDCVNEVTSGICGKMGF